MENIDKRIKGGLPKCPLHKFMSNFIPIKNGWFQCTKCRKYQKVDDIILKDITKYENIKIGHALIGKHIAYKI